MRFPLGVVGLLISAASQADSQAVIAGTVREDSTGRPLPGVEVVIDNGARRAVTDLSGRYAVGGLSRGSHVALFRLVGFRAVRQALEVGNVDTAWVNPLLVPAAVTLPEVEVRVEEEALRGSFLEGFKERRRMGFGKFIDSTVLRQTEHLRLSDVLRRHTPVKLTPGRFGELWAESTRKPGPNGERCWMQVVLDGAILFRPAWDGPGKGDVLKRPDLSRDLSVSDLEAVEVYQSAAGTPAEFNNASAACGTIVLWTRQALKP